MTRSEELFVLEKVKECFPEVSVYHLLDSEKYLVFDYGVKKKVYSASMVDKICMFQLVSEITVWYYEAKGVKHGEFLVKDKDFDEKLKMVHFDCEFFPADLIGILAMQKFFSAMSKEE